MTGNDLNTQLGKQIKAARLKRGMTQQTLAKDLGLSRPSLIAYESGKTPPTVDLVAEMARILNVEFEIDSCVITRRDTKTSGTPILPKAQLCFEFGKETNFVGAMLRIKPTKETLTITAVVPIQQVG